MLTVFTLRTRYKIPHCQELIFIVFGDTQWFIKKFVFPKMQLSHRISNLEIIWDVHKIIDIQIWKSFKVI